VTSKDGFVYAGVGPSKANIAAYEIRTGQRREILPQDAQVAEFPKVFHGADGNVYATVGKREFRLSQWNATELEPENTVPAAPRNALRDGRTLSLALKNGVFTLTVTNPATHNQVEHTIAYRGHELPVFRIGFGPDAVLYGSSYMPAAFSKADFNRHRMEEIGAVGNGEVYSFLSKGERLLMAAYGGMAVLMSYQPEGPFHPAAVSGNPVLIPVEKGDLGWRPMAMLDGPDGNVYVGVVAGYGQLEAPLLVWNVEANSVQRYEDIVHDQGIVSLAAWHDLIIGGTSINGGGGSHPTQNNAKLFIWDPKTRQKEFEIVPLSGAKSITDLIKAPNDMVYGIADNTLFEFNPAARKITKKKTLPFSNLIYNSVSVDHDGRIWGLAKDGIFMIDTTTFRASLVARSPVPITGGFASKDGKIYFISGTAVYSYKM
jgi:hypothetical protein